MSVPHEASTALPSEIMSGTYWTGGRVGPSAGLGVLEKKKNTLPGFEPRTVQPVA